ncbi:uncharacterized protein FOMMEDRAFT_137152 [Fomitiporia mediterranea MF3/22]|uniref:uncharacterized protein n=1 Tax=Fomitiporia mediterranea (strain MF3/22) TaxID=694068 RepID=UPI000440880C|nr:uncharacterized protein FOMMEDRAFT_137152 [Fomitiporia mediterranea MF3/22]EJC98230.1 hypothetical protein FOMMEDRAFT_137152 [Fomitiporia mediterranea MF3/22]
MWIGVKHKTLVFDNAVAAAITIKDILSQAGFPDIEVAFRESEVTHSAGLKLLPFNPLVDPIPDFRKPFTPTLGLSITPFKTPYYEGTGALYFRLSRDDDRVVLLTAAHVARPLPPREEIVALGSMGYQNATNIRKKSHFL